ncbi:fibronectin type III domain-containing protein [Candidatus Daviesbacteria bacterium]|nr:fibronectin type III domain-containing protein [Candidatus Daviesbacteria bacterium]
MSNILNKFKIPTLLGLALLIFGIGSGVYLVLQNQTLITTASPDISPQNVVISNIEGETVTLSWQTQTPVIGFITYGQRTANEKTKLDDRDETQTIKRRNHYITLKGLLPASSYLLKIHSGNFVTPSRQFSTAPLSSNQNGLGPTIGSVIDGDKPLHDGLVYLSIPNATIQSAVITDLGSFIIPLSQLRTADLTAVLNPPADTEAKLEVISPDGRVARAIFKLSQLNKPLILLKMGQDLNLTLNEASPAAYSKFDLNKDGLINSSDYAIVLKNMGTNPKEKGADLNDDEKVDKKDLDLIQKEINQ